ncbi:hypothetical protein [Rathayibacter soli]|nr:hypothetical protein [Glaciibacter superstes]
MGIIVRSSTVKPGDDIRIEALTEYVPSSPSNAAGGVTSCAHAE